MSSAVLKLKANPTFLATVAIPLPDGEGTHEIGVTFKHKNKAALEEFITGESARSRSDVDSVLEIVESWTGLDGDFNRDNLTEFLQNYHGAARAIVSRYVEKLSQARLGN